MTDCTLVMYHYVRNLSKSRYPDLNALSVDEFRYQLDHLKSEYSFVTAADLLSAFRSSGTLPDDAALLTFDDGFAEHYETVFPILKQRGIQGAFFPPVEPVRNDAMLDVHKIHVILARRETDRQLLDTVFDLLERYRDRFALKPPREYYDELAKDGRWDPKEIIFVKRLLQHGLPKRARETLLDDLFERYISVDEKTLSREWYMTEDQLRVMVDNGMYVGSHTANHYRLDRLSRQEVVDEVEVSLSFLDDIGSPTENWIMSYPYGAYDETTIDVLREFDCGLGITTEPRLADVARDGRFELPRLDTNDLPQFESETRETSQSG